MSKKTRTDYVHEHNENYFDSLSDEGIYQVSREVYKLNVGDHYQMGLLMEEVVQVKEDEGGRACVFNALLH